MKVTDFKSNFGSTLQPKHSKYGLYMNRYLLIIFSFMITPVLTNELSLLESAQQGDSDSQYQLALQYHHGMALEKDHAKDHAEAEKRYRLVPSKKDHTEAVKWYREAANRGSWLALYGISRLYLETDSPQASDVKAVSYTHLTLPTTVDV